MVMNTKICTTIDQTKKLLELEVNIDTADMYYDVNKDGIRSNPDVGKPLFDGIPAWSLSALMNLLMEGERIIGVRSTEFTLVEKPTVDDRTLCS